MTLGQMNSFIQSSASVVGQEQLNMMQLTRIAYHASADEFTDIVSDFQVRN